MNLTGLVDWAVTQLNSGKIGGYTPGPDPLTTADIKIAPGKEVSSILVRAEKRIGEPESGIYHFETPADYQPE